jgi:DNA processing protein
MRVQRLSQNQLPPQLQAIGQPPEQLWVRGADLASYQDQPLLSVVGSRAISPYGRAAVQQVLPDVIRQSVTIVSGLALGTDALAHQTALSNAGRTIAVLPSSVNLVYPASNRQLAEEILKHNGSLISEYPDGSEAMRHQFIERNRLVSGLSQAVLIVEATEKSGTLHTANFALEQGREVLAIPGNITSPHSAGTNSLIKAGATPVTCSKDILRALGIEQTEQQQTIFASSPEEAILIELLQSGITDGIELLQRSKLNTSLYSQTLTMLELNGVITALGNDRWHLS